MILTNNPSKEIAEAAQKIGTAMILFWHSSRSTHQTMRDLHHNLEVPIDLAQVACYYTPSGQPVGIVTWAWLTDDGLEKARSRGIDALHISEWREGPHLFIANIVVARQFLRKVLRTFANETFPSENHIYWLKSLTHEQGAKVRVWRRHSNT